MAIKIVLMALPIDKTSSRVTKPVLISLVVSINIEVVRFQKSGVKNWIMPVMTNHQIILVKAKGNKNVTTAIRIVKG